MRSVCRKIGNDYEDAVFKVVFLCCFVYSGPIVYAGGYCLSNGTTGLVVGAGFIMFLVGLTAGMLALIVAIVLISDALS